MAHAQVTAVLRALAALLLLSALPEQLHGAPLARSGRAFASSTRHTAHKLASRKEAPAHRRAPASPLSSVSGECISHNTVVTIRLCFKTRTSCESKAFFKRLTDVCQHRRPAGLRRKASEVDLSTPAGEQQFLYVYELPEELNVAHQALPTYWHDQQYDCERTAICYQYTGFVCLRREARLGTTSDGFLPSGRYCSD